MVFADDWFFIFNSEDTLQRALHEVHRKIQKYNLILYVEKYKVMTFYGAFPKITKLMIEDRTIVQVSWFNFLGCSISYLGEIDVWNKIECFNRMNDTIKHTLKNKVRKEML